MYERIFKLQAKTIKALAHSRRLEIVQLLQDQEMSVTDIYQMLDLPQANVSQHLTLLKQAGVLKTRKDGKQIYYQVADAVFTQIITTLRKFLVDKHQHSEIADEFSFNMNELVPLTHDPVCHMRVSPKTAGFATTYQNKSYYFCASGCYAKFSDNPEKFITTKETEQETNDKLSK